MISLCAVSRATVAPIQVLFSWQHQLILETDAEGETTASSCALRCGTTSWSERPRCAALGRLLMPAANDYGALLVTPFASNTNDLCTSIASLYSETVLIDGGGIISFGRGVIDMPGISGNFAIRSTAWTRNCWPGLTSNVRSDPSGGGAQYIMPHELPARPGRLLSERFPLTSEPTTSVFG